MCLLHVRLYSNDPLRTDLWQTMFLSCHQSLWSRAHAENGHSSKWAWGNNDILLVQYHCSYCICCCPVKFTSYWWLCEERCSGALTFWDFNKTLLTMAELCCQLFLIIIIQGSSWPNNLFYFILLWQQNQVKPCESQLESTNIIFLPWVLIQIWPFKHFFPLSILSFQSWRILSWWIRNDGQCF